MSGRPEPFWLCHECGAQMRPIKRNDVNHCASCDGEFLEILDDEVNPDPYHELPPPPPVRPGSAPGRAHSPLQDGPYHAQGPPGNFIQQLMGGLFGAAVDPDDPHAHEGEGPNRLNPGSATNRAGQGGAAGAGRGGQGSARTWQFNIGGGNASISFGTVGGMGPFGPAGQDDRGLDDFFPGFGAPPGADARPRQHVNPFAPPHQHPLGQGDPLGAEELLRTLFAGLGADIGHGPMGPGGQSSLGDYVMTERGFDHILEQLMQQAGPQGPIPASDTVIEGLPRSKLTEESLEKSTFKDCPVCKDDFSVGDEVIKVPCAHIFHPDCIQPWLKVNGSCPVCRFSLVPDESNNPPQQSSSAQNPSQTQSTSTQPQSGLSDSTSPTPDNDDRPSPLRPGPPSRSQSGNMVTSVLQRLWGPSGIASPNNPSSPINETRPQASRSSSTHESTPQMPGGLYSGGGGSGAETMSQAEQAEHEEQAQMSRHIPEEYRDRHRRREQQQQQERDQFRPGDLHDDLD